MKRFEVTITYKITLEAMNESKAVEITKNRIKSEPNDDIIGLKVTNEQ